MIALLTGWCILAIFHFSTPQHLSLRHGFDNKISYSTINLFFSELTDFDRDGFGPLTLPPDPNNLDSTVNPYAPEIPGNGIDENGLGGDLPEIVVESQKVIFQSIKQPNLHNVIVVIVETFRTDVIGSRQNGTEIMPFLNALGREHTLTTDAYSNYGITGPSIQTVFAGNLYFQADSEFLFDHLKKQGYQTFAISAQSEAWGQTDEILNLNELDYFFDARHKKWDLKSFTAWELMHQIQTHTLDSKEVNQIVFDVIDHRDHRPFVMYLNYQDLHYPYHKSYIDLVFIDEPLISGDQFVKNNRQQILKQYANASYYLDNSIKEMVLGLKARGIFDKTVIVIVGDHPDSIYENGILGHAWTLDKHQRRTPLIVINGQGHYTTPIGQTEILKIIRNSLDGSMGSERATFVNDPEKLVFVLSGRLDRPTQIGFIGPNRLIGYKFTTNRIQFEENGPWLSIGSIEKGSNEYILFVKLIHHWESEVLMQLVESDR